MKIEIIKIKLPPFLIALFWLPLMVLGQQPIEKSYTVINKGNIENIKPYEDALHNINLNQYRLYNNRRVLKFNTGVEVELLSLVEMGINNLELEKPADFDEGALRNSEFVLTASGQIVERVTVETLNTVEKANVNKRAISSEKTVTTSPNPGSSFNHNSLPQDFPKYINTGNPDADQNRYAEEKQNWIGHNPDLYKKISGDNNRRIILKQEFDQMPDGKKKIIKENPDKYIIQ